jgi:hypothetical protein
MSARVGSEIAALTNCFRVWVYCLYLKESKDLLSIVLLVCSAVHSLTTLVLRLDLVLRLGLWFSLLRHGGRERERESRI